MGDLHDKMSTFLAAMRDGQWLTRERIRLWALAMLAASVIGLAFLLATSDGLNDYQGRPLGTDFSNVYAAGTYVLDGKPAAAFDWPAQHARERQIFGDKTPFYGWHYPPYFLFIAGLLALMPYALALAAWQAATLALYLGAVWLILRSSAPKRCALKPRALESPLWLLLALAFPAVFVNIGHGHNGFLTAALIGTALVVLDRRPLVAGVLFGLMAYKPQFGVLIPLVLAATGRWRAFVAAAATVAVLTLATFAAFGPEVWRAFFASAHLTRVEVLEQGGTGWHKIQSVFSMVRMWGGGIPLAYVAQGAVTIAIAAALDLALAQRRGLSAEGRSADRRVDPRHALQPRLRPRDSRPGDRISRGRRPRPRLRALAENRAGVALVHAADRAQHRRADAGSARRAGHAAGVRAGPAAGRGRDRLYRPVAFRGAADKVAA